MPLAGSRWEASGHSLVAPRLGGCQRRYRLASGRGGVRPPLLRGGRGPSGLASGISRGLASLALPAGPYNVDDLHVVLAGVGLPLAAQATTRLASLGLARLAWPLLASPCIVVPTSVHVLRPLPATLTWARCCLASARRHASTCMALPSSTGIVAHPSACRAASRHLASLLSYLSAAPRPRSAASPSILCASRPQEQALGDSWSAVDRELGRIRGLAVEKRPLLLAWGSAATHATGDRWIVPLFRLSCPLRF